MITKSIRQHDLSSLDREDMDVSGGRVLDKSPDVIARHSKDLSNSDLNDSTETTMSTLSESSHSDIMSDGRQSFFTSKDSDISLDVVLEVFPDVSINYATRLLSDCKDSVETVISLLSEGSYPKSKSDGGRCSTDAEESHEVIQRVLEVFPDVSLDYLKELLNDCNESTEAVMSLLAEGSYPKNKSSVDCEDSRDVKDRVLEVFPDVTTDYLNKLLGEYDNSADLVMFILTDDSYPKSKSAITAYSSVSVTRKLVKPHYDYSSATSFVPSSAYIKEALKMLLFEFPFIRIDSMRKFMKKHHKHFTPVRNYLLDSLKQNHVGRKHRNTLPDDLELQQFHALRIVWVTKGPSLDQMMSLGIRHFTLRVVRRPQPTLRDPILQNEVSFAQQQLRDWFETMAAKQQRLQARQRSVQTGNGVECGCCFDKVPIEEMVGCRNEGHLFCVDCIQSYADTQIFSNGSLGVVKATGMQAWELLCCDSSGCQSGFFEEQLQRALNVNTLEKYAELQFRASIEAAGMSEKICTCPKCGFLAYHPLNLTVFKCPMEDCQFESCLKCGREAHLPLKCEEVVQMQYEDQGRLKVEEALAEAKIRKCPKCKTPFVKSDGCNKMTCRCGTHMCYNCRLELDKEKPYDHFNRHGKCVLFTNAEEDDQRAMREAGLTAVQEYRQELQVGGASSRDLDFQVDVDEIMRNGTAGENGTVINDPRPRRRRFRIRR